MYNSSSLTPGADPELLLGGGTNPYGGRLPNVLIIFSEKPYEIKEILVHRGVCAGCTPLNPPLHSAHYFILCTYFYISLTQALTFLVCED